MGCSDASVTFTTNDMVIRGREGTVFIVRDYRRVLREALDLDARERTAFIGRNTIIIGFGEANDVVTAYRDRVLVHAADVGANFCACLLTSVHRLCHRCVPAPYDAMAR